MDTYSYSCQPNLVQVCAWNHTHPRSLCDYSGSSSAKQNTRTCSQGWASLCPQVCCCWCTGKCTCMFIVYFVVWVAFLPFLPIRKLVCYTHVFPCTYTHSIFIFSSILPLFGPVSSHGCTSTYSLCNYKRFCQKGNQLLARAK